MKEEWQIRRIATVTMRHPEVTYLRYDQDTFDRAVKLLKEMGDTREFTRIDPDEPQTQTT
jgi:hypothetical protein